MSIKLNEDLVSVIMPSCNSSRYIKESINSVINQHYKNWELIIVDDSSTDETCHIINKFIKIDNRIKLHKLTRQKGPAFARNKAIDLSLGKYIAFLDSDDIWYPEKLQKQVFFMNHNSYLFSFTSYNLVDESGKPLNRLVDYDSPNKVNYRDLLMKKATIGCLTVVLDRKLVDLNRMPNIPRGQDYAFWLLLLRRNVSAYKLEEVLSTYRIRCGSTSRNKLKKCLAQWYIYRSIEKISLFNSLFFFFNYAKNALFRK